MFHQTVNEPIGGQDLGRTVLKRDNDIKPVKNSLNSTFFLQSGGRHFKGGITEINGLNGFSPCKKIKPTGLAEIDPFGQVGRR